MNKKTEQENLSLGIIMNFLGREYGLFESIKNRLSISLAISCCVWFLLFAFGLFDLEYLAVTRQFLVTGVYSLGCFLTMIINSLFLYKILIRRNTYLSAGLWGLWLMLWIGVSNFTVTGLVFGYEYISFSLLIKNLAYTLSLGMVITPLAILLHKNHMLKKKISGLATENKKGDRQDSTNETRVQLPSSYANDSFELDPEQILYMRSADNYVDVCYKDKKRICHRLIRNTLTGIEEKNLHPGLTRCHRSYIINTMHIRDIKKTRYGYDIHLNNNQGSIPLSEKYQAVFSTYL